MDVQQLRARVAQLESAIDRAKIEGAAATAQLEKEEDENAILSLWAKITARKNAGKTLVEQLAAVGPPVLPARWQSQARFGSTWP